MVNDGIVWGVVGGDMTALSPPVALTTTNSLAASLSGSTAFTLFAGSTYNADFLPGDIVVSAFDVNSFTALSTGIMINLPFLVQGLGAQIQANVFGAFTGTLEAFDVNSVSLGTVSVTSSVQGNGDGSAPFLGAYSTGNLIASVLFTSDQAGVAIDNLALSEPTTSATPEPGTMALTLGVLGALGLGLKRRQA